MPSQKFDVIDGLNITGDIIGSQSLVVKTNVLVANTSTSRVGVGTTSPATTLDIRGTLTSNNVSLVSLTATSENTALVISSANVVSKRQLGLLAFQDTMLDEKQNITDITSATSSVYSIQLANATGNVAGFIDSTGLTFNTGTNVLTIANTVSAATLSSTLVSAANVYSTGDIWTTNRLHHVGDTDSYLEFDADNSLRIWLGGAERAKWTTTTATANVDLVATTVQASKYFVETTYNAGSGTYYNVNVNNGSVHKFTPTGNYGIDFNNFPTTGTASFTLVIDNGGTAHEPTWPDVGEADKIYWAESIEPPGSIGIDIYSFVVVDGQIYGSLSIRNAGFAQ